MTSLFLSGVPYPDFLADLRALVRHEIAALHSPVSASAPAADEVLTLDQAAALLAVCRQTIHEWKRRGLLPYHKLGKGTYFKRADLVASLQRQERTRKAAPTRPATAMPSRR